MNSDYIVITNEYFELLINKDNVEFGNKVLEYSTNKIKEYLEFFNEKSYGKKIKAAYLNTREDFLARIKEVKNEEDGMPPEWASGCFYGDEVQILVKDDINKCFHVLVHETFHLLFGKFVYNKHGFNRIMWLDEALAGNYDDTTKKLIDNGYFKKMIIRYKDNKNLPIMSNFSFNNGVFNTKDYDGYDLVKIIGRYLIETKSNKELLEYINDYDKVIKDSKNILRVSIDYFVKKYEL